MLVSICGKLSGIDGYESFVKGLDLKYIWENPNKNRILKRKNSRYQTLDISGKWCVYLKLLQAVYGMIGVFAP